MRPCAQRISRESHPAQNETASDKWLFSRGEDEKSKPAVFTMSCPSQKLLTQEQVCCVRFVCKSGLDICWSEYYLVTLHVQSQMAEITKNDQQ